MRLKGLATPEARLPGRASAALPELSGAARAGGDAEQPAAAAHVVHRTRARARGNRGDARRARGCSRCSAWAASARRGCRCRSAPACMDALSRRRVVRRPADDSRRRARRERSRARARRARGAGPAADADAVRASQVAQAAADPRQLRAGDRGQRRARERDPARGARRAHPRRRAAIALRVPGEQTYVVQPLPVPMRTAELRGVVEVDRRAAVRRAGEAAQAELRADRARGAGGGGAGRRASRAFRWRSSWRRRACARCRSPRSTRGSRTATSC